MCAAGVGVDLEVRFRLNLYLQVTIAEMQGLNTRQRVRTLIAIGGVFILNQNGSGAVGTRLEHIVRLRPCEIRTVDPQTTINAIAACAANEGVIASGAHHPIA